VVGIVLGQALLLASLPLLVYAVVGWLVMASFVRWYEEPVLHETYGPEYDRYREAVRAWWPRLRPWTQS
jgi:protein-S-isoprenylcysteine O-methyltransferase Ste14